MTDLVLVPIGLIRSPFTTPRGTPIQSSSAAGAPGTVVVEAAYVDALADLAGFERIWLVYHFHRAPAWRPRVVPFRDREERGLFATRAPARPNPVGLSVVELREIRGNEVSVRGIDVLDGTPLLDIKPYVPEFDAWPDARAGWLDSRRSDRRTADDRFAPEPSGE
ncbi:MAG: tRNA (N6-threonylcarbamoyladenosine(37)-N6)-methyltransferase TrmO [Candidatus Krumholzibacteriia bacterium]